MSWLVQADVLISGHGGPISRTTATHIAVPNLAFRVLKLELRLKDEINNVI